MIHDAQLDFYSKRLATCSSDRVVRIIDVDTQKCQSEIKCHTGPVWQVSWAHPKFGALLASCSYDRTIVVNRENAPGQWSPIYTFKDHESSVNSLAWAPHQYGLHLACASSDGKVSVHSYSGGHWQCEIFDAGATGCNAIDWASFNHCGGEGTMRLVTGGCDNLVKIWKRGTDGSWTQDGDHLDSHKDWVRDVAWAPSMGLPCNTIATCSSDGLVYIYTQSQAGQKYSRQVLHDFKVPVWRVSWSITGKLLAVSAGEAQISLWTENLDGTWRQVNTVNEHGNVDE